MSSKSEKEIIHNETAAKASLSDKVKSSIKFLVAGIFLLGLGFLMIKFFPDGTVSKVGAILFLLGAGSTWLGVIIVYRAFMLTLKKENKDK